MTFWPVVFSRVLPNAYWNIWFPSPSVNLTILTFSNVLNLIFIPKIGYLAAAYTTLVGYIVLLLIHMVLVYKLGLKEIYNYNEDVTIDTITYDYYEKTNGTVVISHRYKTVYTWDGTDTDAEITSNN